MTGRTRDRCPHCDRNGLRRDAGGGRRRCELCHKEELRPQDRVLYSACGGEPDFIPGKGWFLRDAGWAKPFFSRTEAEEYLAAAVARAASAKDYKHIQGPFKTEPVTVQGHTGTVVYTNGGPEFYYIAESVVDCSAVLDRQGGSSSGTI